MEPFKFFEDFLSIPRKSGNEKQISDYLVNFALEHNLKFYRDKNYNVIIKKKSNCGSKETIILQGHVDMVCTSNNDYDFINNGIDWFIDDGFYKAKGTTLGADNGIGCSIILSILSDNNIKIPNIEAIFTTSEETNMNGAKTLDYSKITGNKLISVDGTDEGVIDVSSAGMVSINIEGNFIYVDNNMPTYKVRVYGLKGGHSGIDIGKNRGNAIDIMFELLSQLDNYNLVSFLGGSNYNVIPDSCECIITTEELVFFRYDKYSNIGLQVSVEQIEKCSKVIDMNSKLSILRVIHNLPKGVISFNESYPQTSINLALIESSYQHFSIKISIRSASCEEEKCMIRKIKEVSQGMILTIVDEIPHFEFQQDSEIRDLLSFNYKKLFNKEVLINHVHAGLEGGIFAEHIDNLDMCVIAPNIYNIHTVNEKVEIKSVLRVYEWLKYTLENI